MTQSPRTQGFLGKNTTWLAILGMTALVTACGGRDVKPDTEEVAESSETQAQDETQVAEAEVEDASATDEYAGTEGESTATASSDSSQFGVQSADEGSVSVKREVIVETQIPTIQQSRVLADVNRMNAEQFAALGFTDEQAQKIIEARNEKGEFTSVDEVQEAADVGDSTFASIRPVLGINSSGNQAAGQVSPEEPAASEEEVENMDSESFE